MTNEEAILILNNINYCCNANAVEKAITMAIKALELTQTGLLKDCESCRAEKTGRCKDCKHFVYNEFAIVNGIPIIVAHEICSKWGNGCRTKEDGYCHMFEPKMQEVKE